MADLLVVEELLVRYGPITAVRGVSLRVQQGEIVALLGANGAGKSSLLNSVVGLVPVAGGSVTFKGEPILSPRDAKGAKLAEAEVFA